MVVKRSGKKIRVPSQISVIDEDNLTDDEFGTNFKNGNFDAIQLDEMRDEDELLKETERLMRVNSMRNRKKDISNIFPVDQVSSSDDERRDDDVNGYEDDTIVGGWGKRKRSFYGGNPNDRKGSEVKMPSDSDEIDEDELEGKEAKILQAQHLELLNEEDFFETFAIEPAVSKSAEEKWEKSDLEIGSMVQQDLTRLSKKQRIRLFNQESPEFSGISADFILKMNIARNKLKPILELISTESIPDDCSLAKLVKFKYHLILNYCLNILSYVMLKSKRVNLKVHPVTTRLVQYKHLLTRLEEGEGKAAKLDKLVTDRIDSILQKIEEGCSINDILSLSDLHQKHQTYTSKRHGQTNLPKMELQKAAVCSNEDKKSKSVEFDIMEKCKDFDAISKSNESVSEEEEGRRAISYQIAKNKGLKPKRSKLQRNPRVKYRAKYADAIVRRKGQIRPMRNEAKIYMGEMSGINARVKKGVKLM